MLLQLVVKQFNVMQIFSGQVVTRRKLSERVIKHGFLPHNIHSFQVERWWEVKKLSTRGILFLIVHQILRSKNYKW